MTHLAERIRFSRTRQRPWGIGGRTGLGEPAGDGSVRITFSDGTATDCEGAAELGGQVANRPFYAASGVTLTGECAILGL